MPTIFLTQMDLKNVENFVTSNLFSAYKKRRALVFARLTQFKFCSSMQSLKIVGMKEL